jgi:hypothetical protein
MISTGKFTLEKLERSASICLDCLCEINCW